MFAKLGGKKWKGGDVAKTFSKYFSLLYFGLNVPKTYVKAEDKPEWWPSTPKLHTARAFLRYHNLLLKPHTDLLNMSRNEGRQCIEVPEDLN